jgi:hypothetical protein
VNIIVYVLQRNCLNPLHLSSFFRVTVTSWSRGSALDLHSRGAQLSSAQLRSERDTNCPDWVFVFFLKPYIQMLGLVRLCPLLPYPSQFMSHLIICCFVASILKESAEIMFFTEVTICQECMKQTVLGNLSWIFFLSRSKRNNLQNVTKKLFVLVTISILLQIQMSIFSLNLYRYWISVVIKGGSAVVKALCYKLEGRGFDTRWGDF